MNKLPPCTCSAHVPDGRVCGCCHAGMLIQKECYPGLAQAIDGALKTLNESEHMEQLTKTFSSQDGHFSVPDLADKYIKNKDPQ